jgi:23S rRNA (adenine2503-C2)-methyltransferase
MPPHENLYGLDVPALAARLGPFGAKPYAARQVSAWMYRRRARAFTEMSDLSGALRSAMAARFTIETPQIDTRFPSIDGTVRYLIALPDGGRVEAVAIPERGRMTFCISSQVGCALACTFCMTGTLGLTRHLTSGEIAGQVDLLMEDTGFAVNHFNIVFMGMGEPLHNYDGTVGALRVLAGSDGFAIGAKRITVSTAGMAPEIERLAGEGLRVRLAVSLSATTDETRSALFPINRKYPIARLLEACRTWAERSGEKVFVEYVLLAGENDTALDAARLARLVRGVAERINLIPFNETPLLPHRATSWDGVTRFRDALVERGFRASIRRSRGRDVAGACGMLAFGAGVSHAGLAARGAGVPAPPAPNPPEKLSERSA